jgi:hypothetical protein
VAGERWGIDFNGDGVEDGYLLVASTKLRIAAGREIGLDDHSSASAVMLDVGAPLTDASSAI